MHEGGLDLLIAEPADASVILKDLRTAHPAIASLLVVDQPETSPQEIRRPFTQQVMLERVSALLAARASCAATSSSSTASSGT